MLAILLACLLVLFAFLYRKISHDFDYFSKQRIPTEKPVHHIVGNLWNFWKQVQFQRDIKNMQRYGKVWGSFEGNRPAWNIADPDLIREIGIKEFDHFTDRRIFFPLRDPTLSKMLVLLKGEEWKNVRSSVSPVFSSGKIKKMSLLMESCGEALVEQLRKAIQKSQGVVNIRDQFGAYTLNVIATCAFGTKLESLGEENDPFTRNARKFLADNPVAGTPFFIIPFVFPSLMNVGLNVMPMAPLYFFRDLIRDIMKQRKAERNERGDALDAMLEQAEKEKQEGGAEAQIVMTDDVITAQSILFFGAGFDTTAAMMTFLTYSLALHPDIQDRVHQEIEKNIQEHGGINHEMINACVYLEQVVQETLRLYPPNSRLERECTKDCIINGMEFKKGDFVFIPVNAVHSSRDYYPDPEVFDPERFSPEKKSSIVTGAFIPFGIGPRNCIGMRFALEEGKLALCHLIHSFRILKCPETPVPMEWAAGVFGTVPHKKTPVKVKLESRL